MRNIVQYPITTTEIVETLNRLGASYVLSDAIGGTEGLCLDAAKRRVLADDTLKEALRCVRNQDVFLELPRYVRELVDRALDDEL